MARRRVRQTGSAASAAQLVVGRWCCWVLTLATVVSGLRVVEAANDMRGLYRELGEVQARQDKLAAEQSRLMLERGALSSMQNIEQIARSELGMVFPEQIEQVLE